MSIDYLNNKAASRRLAEDITSYWRKKGFPQFRAWSEEEEYSAGGPKTKEPNVINVVRSNIGIRWNADKNQYEGYRRADQ